MAGEPAATGFLSLWNTYGSAITGGAVIVTAACALWVILANRAIARRRATLDLILHIESDHDPAGSSQPIHNLKKSTTRSRSWGTEDQRDSEEAIRTVLNINELIAVAINEGVIDERVYRRWFNKAFIDDFKAMTGCIEEVEHTRKVLPCSASLNSSRRSGKTTVAGTTNPVGCGASSRP